MPPKTERTPGQLFGEIACLRGLVSPEQLYKALTAQKREQAAGRIPPKLGAILIEMGAMTPDQVSEVLAEMDRP